MCPVTTAALKPKTSPPLELSRSLRIVFSRDILVVASDFNTQLGYLAETAGHIRDRFSVPIDRADNVGNLIWVYSD